MIVLDMNIVSEAGRQNPDARVKNWMRIQPLTDLYLCAPVVAELSFGAQRMLLKTGSDRLLTGLRTMVDRTFNGRILHFDGPAAELAGRLQARREAEGRPIAIGDLWIAAICLHHGATLATRNTRDFLGLDLRLENPFEHGH
ncbi:MAG: type II toxin-antitoxin system VapC family toxin [Hoeflea sp.]|uniref:type II toxin-antitoxin system VapC family toxin n=1 Tax=Hoeflea sp. TaxID=1940281 RepID=UPI002730735C|nr:type II toxin-antitoxin system VapC family toxin [Hoeflea sp.]MDP2120759.1 type II toxin-antitoxin system VapC family toxin [Hoeflea sp.]MDP3525681.1 type II toxin-antitoxin system VapC family toxin [Hoeflea sp.]